MSSHVLVDIIRTYIKEHKDLRENHLDLENVLFHRSYGLSLVVPLTWPVSEAIKIVVLENPQTRFLVIYSTTADYRVIWDELNGKVSYLSWHEILTAMQFAGNDIRYIQKAKATIEVAEMIFFLQPPSQGVILDQVRGYANGGLIILGQDR